MRQLTHGLYFRPEKHKVDYRTRLGKTLKAVTAALLEQFPSPPPVAAQLLAQRTAFKLVRAANFEAFMLQEPQAGGPTLNADQDYLKLTASIRADIQALFVMSKQGSGLEKEVPDLQTYLEALKKGGSNDL
ncbi:MAG: hypothetical protein ACOZFS_04535 [Thermodesulfobacteriota bacterium]